MIPVVFILMGILIVWAGIERNQRLTNRNNNTGLTNQFYTRATNCFAAVTPTQRTPEHVKWCYDEAERATGVKGERYSPTHN